MSGKLYQVQNGQKVDVTPQVVSLSSGTKRNVGEIVYSMVPLEDAGMHLLDGSVLSSSGAYAEAVAYITGLQSTYPQLFTTEANWQASVSQYEVCGKFVVGSGTLRLPKVTGFIEGTVDPAALGQLVEAGLPNITGRGGATSNIGAVTTGAVWKNTEQSNIMGVTNPGSTWTFDASRSSPVYGNSTTVQPQAIKGFVYMVVANSIKTPVQVDINRIAADLALKADVDMGNATAAGKAVMAHAAMPSGQYIDLTLPASGGTVTAPGDGYIQLHAISNSTNVCYTLLGNVSSRMDSAALVQYNGFALPAYVPCSSGDTIRITYGNVRDVTLRFIYANGSAPQP